MKGGIPLSRNTTLKSVLIFEKQANFWIKLFALGLPLAFYITSVAQFAFLSGKTIESLFDAR